MMDQQEQDAMWQNLCHMLKAGDCHRTKAERKSVENRNTLRWWNKHLTASFYHPLDFSASSADVELNFPEVQQRFGQLHQNREARDVQIAQGNAELGRSFGFVSQSCDYCSRHSASMPVCECGESYCSPECRLADWDGHKKICAQALPASTLRKLNKAWLVLRRGYTVDVEGRTIEIHHESGDADAMAAMMMEGMQEGCAQQ
jgi:hypothetical protein